MSDSSFVFAQNPRVADIDITYEASAFLWAVFAIMSVSSMGLLVFGTMRPAGQRAFHNLGAAICATAAIAYFCMAADLGAAAIQVEYIRGGSLGQNWVDIGVLNPTRSIWYARYIDWTVTTPLLLLELLLATGLPLSEVFTVIFFDEVMIITGLIGALVSSSYKWGLFTFGCVAEVYIWWALLFPARASATRLGPDYKSSFVVSAVILSFLWLLYPVAWGLADGGNVITPTSEMIFYGVLDVLAKPVFCFYHCYTIGKCNYARLGFGSGKYSETMRADEQFWHAKHNGDGLEHVKDLMPEGGSHGLHGREAVGAEPRHSTATAVDHDATFSTTSGVPPNKRTNQSRA